MLLHGTCAPLTMLRSPGRTTTGVHAHTGWRPGVRTQAVSEVPGGLRGDGAPLRL